MTEGEIDVGNGLACRRCGGWGHYRHHNDNGKVSDRIMCDLCNGTGFDPLSGPIRQNGEVENGA